MYSDEVNATIKAAQGQYGAVPQRPYYGDERKMKSIEPPTLRGEAEARVGHHRQEAEKADKAAAFFRENPAFDEFVRLVRQGAIQI